MRKRRRSIRRTILAELFKHLKSCYGFRVTPDSVRGVWYSNAGIDSLLAFKSDTRLDDLHDALLRIEAGTFGICIACKRPMTRAQLEYDVTMRVCPSCEAEFNHRHQEKGFPASLPREACPATVSDTPRSRSMVGMQVVMETRTSKGDRS